MALPPSNHDPMPEAAFIDTPTNGRVLYESGVWIR